MFTIMWELHLFWCCCCLCFYHTVDRFRMRAETISARASTGARNLYAKPTNVLTFTKTGNNASIFSELAGLVLPVSSVSVSKLAHKAFLPQCPWVCLRGSGIRYTEGQAEFPVKRVTRPDIQRQSTLSYCRSPLVFSRPSTCPGLSQLSSSDWWKMYTKVHVLARSAVDRANSTGSHGAHWGVYHQE